MKLDLILLIFELALAGFTLGWVLCFTILNRRRPDQKSYRILFNLWLRKREESIKAWFKMTPRKIDAILYAGLFCLLAAIWLSNLVLYQKILFSGIWLIGMALWAFLSREEPVEITEEE